LELINLQKHQLTFSQLYHGTSMTVLSLPI
jgi:hypothetical protein